MSRTRAFTHPLGVTLLLAGVGLAIWLAVREPESGRAAWAIIWGLLAYAAVVAAVRWRRQPSAAAPARPSIVNSSDTADDFVRLTEEALRRMNNPAALASCGLLARLPRTLAAASGTLEDGATIASSPLEQAKALRTVLSACIERLKTGPEDATSDESQMLQYVILRDEYIAGRPNTQIITRHSISESTFHRYRRQGIRALADELTRQEALLRKP